MKYKQLLDWSDEIGKNMEALHNRLKADITVQDAVKKAKAFISCV